MASCLGFGGRGGRGGRGGDEVTVCHRSLPCPSLSTVCLKSSASQQPMGARIMVLHKVSRVITDHEPSPLLPKDLDKVPGGCPNHRHKLGLRWQCRSPTPTHGSTAYRHQCGIRPLPTSSVVTRTMDANPGAGYSRALNPDMAAMTPPK